MTVIHSDRSVTVSVTACVSRSISNSDRSDRTVTENFRTVTVKNDTKQQVKRFSSLNSDRSDRKCNNFLHSGTSKGTTWGNAKKRDRNNATTVTMHIFGHYGHCRPSYPQAHGGTR